MNSRALYVLSVTTRHGDRTPVGLYPGAVPGSNSDDVEWNCNLSHMEAISTCAFTIALWRYDLTTHSHAGLLWTEMMPLKLSPGDCFVSAISRAGKCYLETACSVHVYFISLRMKATRTDIFVRCWNRTTINQGTSTASGAGSIATGSLCR